MTPIRVATQDDVGGIADLIERVGLLLIQQQTVLTADWSQISSLCDMRGLRSLILPEELKDKHTSR